MRYFSVESDQKAIFIDMFERYNDMIADLDNNIITNEDFDWIKVELVSECMHSDLYAATMLYPNFDSIDIIDKQFSKFDEDNLPCALMAESVKEVIQILNFYTEQLEEIINYKF